MKKNNQSLSTKLLLLATICAALALSSCATRSPEPVVVSNVPKPKPAFRMYDWRGDSISGAARVEIYLDTQRAFFFRDERLVGWTHVATGIASHKTPVGDYKILEKVKDKHSNLYGQLLDENGKVINRDFDTRKGTVEEGQTFKPSAMPLFMRMSYDGVGMHVGKIPRVGRPASHGCIRLPRFMAEKFFANVQIGTPVLVRQETPEELRDIDLDHYAPKVEVVPVKRWFGRKVAMKP